MTKKKFPYWNHNTAYFSWIGQQLANGEQKILDVGCGDGRLAMYLSAKERTIIGIDPDEACIQRACSQNKYENNLCFQTTTFEDFQAESESFDAIIFVASLHHMDMTRAVQKVVSLLKPEGHLIIVGLAKPSAITDWLIEAVRIIPVKISNFLHHTTTTEALEVPVSYNFPRMNAVRQLLKTELQGATLRRGLYYRYLLSWQKSSMKQD
ncbi:class I SAM-dependent methyltransferase [Streptococcus dentiloxodontae]